MGIINCTPDSFFSGSRNGDASSALESALQMISDGVDILDLGGESTRPGSSSVSAREQIDRVLPAIHAIREESDVTISIDTRLAEVAEAALDAGADIINDISSFSDSRMASLAAERGVSVILMHMQGIPTNMQDGPEYVNVIDEIRESLLYSVDKAVNAGISRDRIILDPGIGFGKRHKDNLALLAKIPLWRPPGFPVLIGLSRKSFLGRILGSNDEDKAPEDSPADRLNATTAAHAWCLNRNVDILRVHDVKETRELISIWEALSWAS